MTPEEAIEIIHEKHMDMEFYFAEHDRYPKYYDFEFDQATLIAAQAIKEIRKYREIGTVEECREAMEKQVPKIPEFIHMLGQHIAKFKCPICGLHLNYDCTDTQVFYCKGCGQALKMESEYD